MRFIYPLAISFFVFYGLADSFSQDTSKLKNTLFSLSGYYHCDGKSDEGNVYNGLVVIVKKEDIYVVSWLLEDGSAMKGIGILNGINFSIGWVVEKGGQLVRGVTSYTIESKDEKLILKGGWSTFPGNGKINEEVLTPIKKIPNSGDS